MLILDALLRYSAFALLVLLIILIVRDARRSIPARYAALLCITAVAILLGTSPAELRLPHSLHIIVRFLDFPSMVLAWWFGRSLFEDDFRLGWLEWLAMVLITIPVFWYRLYEFEVVSFLSGWVIVFTSTLSIAMMSHLVFTAVKGRNDDLVESRRRARVYFLIVLAVSTIIIVVGERLFWETHAEALNTVRAALILFMAFWGALWMLRLEVEKLSFETKIKHQRLSEPAIDPRDKALYNALLEQMGSQKAYLEPGLSIRSLAEHLATPEHRLRALINKGMGYRNFSSFVNSYRIEAIKQAMQQPENIRTPILTLAMNTGYNSLTPFNRAFLSITGETPTAYRANLLE